MTAFAIESRQNCLLIDAPYGLSVPQFSQVCAKAPRGSVLDSRLAIRMRLFGVIGLSEDLAALGAELTRTGELIPLYANRADLIDKPANLAQWLANGERTIVSDGLFSLLTGANFYDCARGVPTIQCERDLRSCVRMLKACPQLQSSLGRIDRADKWFHLAAPLHTELQVLLNALDTSQWDLIAQEFMAPTEALS